MITKITLPLSEFNLINLNSAGNKAKSAYSYSPFLTVNTDDVKLVTVSFSWTSVTQVIV